MIKVKDIVDFLGIENIVGNQERNIVNAIQLSTENDRDDVIMCVSAKFRD